MPDDTYSNKDMSAYYDNAGLQASSNVSLISSAAGEKENPTLCRASSQVPVSLRKAETMHTQFISPNAIFTLSGVK